jgi:dihydroorotate dehydrogenase
MTIATDLYARTVRPVLFRMSAERAHAAALRTLRREMPWRLLGSRLLVRDDRLRVEIGGLKLQNPIGLAPGMDKNGTALPGLAHLGFGYICVGSITREPRAGNPRPRLRRDPRQLAVLNALGLPGVGIERALRTLRHAQGLPVPVIASVAGFDSDELLELATAVEPYVDAVEIGLVCPNSTESERMQEIELFSAIVRGLAGRRRKPIFVKLPPHHDEAGTQNAREMVGLAADAGLDGLSVSGSRSVPIPGFAVGRGSIAGRPIHADSLRVVRDVAGWAAGRIAVRGAGGVFTGSDALAMLRAGADAVEVYSAMIFRGPMVAHAINRELLAELDTVPGTSVATLR